MSLVREIDDRDFAREVLEAPGLVLVDFWAPWCGPCRMMAPVLEKLAAAWAGKLRVVKVDVDRSSQWAQELNVRGIPALFFFREGRAVDGVVGYQSEQDLARRIERLVPAA